MENPAAKLLCLRVAQVSCCSLRCFLSIISFLLNWTLGRTASYSTDGLLCSRQTLESKPQMTRGHVWRRRKQLYNEPTEHSHMS
jgi:hypothetical protein